MSKKNPVKPIKYSHVSTKDFGCVINKDGQWEAHFPLDTKAHINNAKVRYESFKNKPSKSGITTECVHAGLRKKICTASKKKGMTNSDWFKRRCTT